MGANGVSKNGQSGQRDSSEKTEIIGRYALYGEIASGGMATVHFGRQLGHVGFSRPVAIKRLHPQFAKEPDVRAMFVDEARLVSRIRHPNVVPTLDIVATDGQLLLVMEYVHGESLAKLARTMRDRRERIPQRIVLTVMSSVLHGLHAAHEAKTESGEPLEIVHRDVSPQNVLVGTDGIARVLDFGIARAAVRLESTREGVIKGKLAYMPPEQLGGTPVTRQADIYASAVILWELLAGRRLFLRGDDGQSVLIDKMLRGTIEPPSDHASEVSKDLDAITLRALDRDPVNRFASAREMAIALEKAGDLATPSEIGEWVERTAAEALGARTYRLQELERTSSKHRVMTASQIDIEMLLDDSDISDELPTPHDDRASVSSAPLTSPKSSTYPILHPKPESLSPSHASIPVLGGHDHPRVARAERATIGLRVAAIGGITLATLLGVGTARVVGGAMSHGSGARAREADNASVATAIAMHRPPSCPRGTQAIPGGKFFMGSDDGLPMEKPAHNVTLAPYCIDTFEVTTEEYKACSDRGECKRAGITNEWDGIADVDRKVFDPLCNVREPNGRGKHPINCVDWEMAAQFCKAQHKRLPSEAEWEFAARGSDGRKYPWGDEEPGPTLLNACGKECMAWGKKNSVEERAMFSADDGWATTSPVGSYPNGASRYGVQDVVGNVWEWVSDYYATYSKEDAVDPAGPNAGEEHVIRGGAWNGGFASWVRPTFRYKDVGSKRSYGIGFRCAKTF
jgi:formylglycine-generating enzyme required for sulfatase activity/serine/threonine protein kinase